MEDDEVRAVAETIREVSCEDDDEEREEIRWCGQGLGYEHCVAHFVDYGW